MSRSLAALGAVPFLALVAACDGKQAQSAATDSAAAAAAPATASVPAPSGGALGGGPNMRDSLPETVRLALDSGNVAFRAGQYAAALTAYRAAAASAPDIAAPWYGVYMVAQATKNQKLADSALAAVRTRSADAGLWSDTLMKKAHDGNAVGAGAAGGAMPGGHPPVGGPPPGMSGGMPPGHPPMGGAAVPPSGHQPVPPKGGAAPRAGGATGGR